MTVTRKLLFTARFGVTHRLTRIMLGTLGVVAAYRYDLPLGLVGLLLIASGIVGWCSVCDTAESATRRWYRPLRRGLCRRRPGNGAAA